MSNGDNPITIEHILNRITTAAKHLFRACRYYYRGDCILANQSISAKLQQPVIVYQPHPGIGDLMWHLPFFRAIATNRADGRIVLFTRSSTKAKELLVCEPAITQIHYLPYRRGIARHIREITDAWQLIRRLGPRSIWILDKIPRPAIAAKMANVGERYGFGFGNQKKWLTGPVLNEHLRQSHQLEKLKAMMIASDIAVPDTEPCLRLPGEIVDRMASRFALQPRPWFTLGIGARDAERCWPYEYFNRLIEKLAYTGGTFFILGGPGDNEEAKQYIINATDYPHSVNVCPLPMDEAAALISLCDMFVGNDSGPMNVAAAVAVPTVGLFGVTPPLGYSRYIRPLCSPRHNRTMAAITPEQVISFITKLLDATPMNHP
ncbi:MAG: glycosyltransferase family 9 protein [Gammaproteobacteria bacterium]